MNKTAPNQTTRKYWQSLEEKQDLGKADWGRPEFPEGEKAMREAARQNGTSRRDFLKFMGASAVMATAACRRPTEQIIPAVRRPPEIIPGLPTFYSTTAPDGTGLIVRTRDGRPIKIAGNPDHPLTAGGATASEIAALMDLYDPDRLRKPVIFETKKDRRRKKVVADSEIASTAREHLKAGDYVLLTSPLDSPTTRALVQDFLKEFPGGRHVELRPDPVLRQIAEGQSECYGEAVVPTFRFDRAQLVVSIDGDFLGTMVQPAYFSAAFAKGRDLRTNKKAMNRLVVFESNYSLTGSNADDRYGIRPGDQALIALAIASYLIVEQRRSNLAGNGEVQKLLAQYRPENIVNALKHEDGLYRKGNFEQIIARVAEDLWAHRGTSLVVGGSPLAATGNNAAAQIAINLLNSILDNDGKTVAYGQPLQHSPGASDREIQAVLAEIGTKYKTVVIAGANPVYHLPPSANAKEALSKAGYVLALSDRLDETAGLASAVLPVSHYLESWGDTELIAGVHGIRQPVIRPLYNTLSFEDRLIQLAGGKLGGAASFHDYVKNAWRRLAGGRNFRKFWVAVLQAGYFAPGRAALKAARPARNFRAASISRIPRFAADAAAGSASNQLVLGLYYGVQVFDGTGANNSLRQELPDPVTKIVWDNYVAILPATARRLGLKQGSVVELKARNGASLRLPVHLQPGLHPETACVALGYGRTDAGHTANGVGVNALALVDTGSDSFALSGAAVELVKTGERQLLASTQTIYRRGLNDQAQENAPFTPKGAHEVPYNGSSQYTALNSDGTRFQRPIVREANFEEFKTGKYELDPPGVKYPKDVNLMPEWDYKSNRWHMVVDLNSCTGCGACVTSCNSENNIPMVGREQVSLGREMHWLRIDRYFSGEEDRPAVSHQLMLCQQCENAPCENVCPVTATTHNSEGLNVMTYNRCVGTRYCANNCPYKVRRFNWYENWNYMEGLARYIRDPQHLGLNPDVTVRTRGVMEKCTFCIQRIAVARQEARARGDKYVRDGAVQTACQEVCPSGGISFGNINDPESTVSRLLKSEAGRTYRVLDFLGVKPQVTYLAKVRNRAES